MQNKTTILCTINYTMIKSIIMPCSWLTNLDNEMLHKRRASKRSGSRTGYVLFAAVNTCRKSKQEVRFILGASSLCWRSCCFVCGSNCVAWRWCCHLSRARQIRIRIPNWQYWHSSIVINGTLKPLPVLHKAVGYIAWHVVPSRQVFFSLSSPLLGSSKDFTPCCSALDWILHLIHALINSES
jgi:hypothetical protein